MSAKRAIAAGQRGRASDLAQQSGHSVLDDLPAARNIRGDQRPGHRAAFEQRSRQSFAIGRQHDRARLGDERTNIIGRARDIRPALRPPIASALPRQWPSGSGIEPAEQLEPGAGILRPGQLGRLDELPHALVRQQSPDEQEDRLARSPRAWPAQIVPGRSPIPATTAPLRCPRCRRDRKRSRSSGFWKKTTCEPAKARR